MMLGVSLPVFGFLGWGIWAIHDGERGEAPAPNGLAAPWVLAVSVFAGAAVMGLAMVADPQYLWQTATYLALAACTVAVTGWFTAQRVAGPFIAAWGFHIGFSTMSFVQVMVMPFETGWEGLFYLVVLLGGVPVFAITATVVVWIRVRRDRLGDVRPLRGETGPRGLNSAGHAT